MKRITLAVALLAIAPVYCVAATPATQPASAVAPTDPASPAPATGTDDKAHRGVDRPGNEGRPRGGQRAIQALTADEKAAAAQFMKDHSPRRQEAIASVQDETKKANFQNKAAIAAVNLMRTEKENPDLYKVMVHRVELEDKIFGKVADLKRESAEKQDAIRTDLKAEVGELFDVDLQERKLRLKALQKIVADQQTSLDSDTADRATLVDQRYNAIVNSDARGGLIPGGGGPINGPAANGGQHGHGNQHP